MTKHTVNNDASATPMKGWDTDERLTLQENSPDLLGALGPWSSAHIRSAAEFILPDVRAGKNTLVYNVHSYSTKVPYQGIAPFISHFTTPGDRVLDPFCGSGMTGIAAILFGRHATLVDISPAAIHIASNYVTPCDVEMLSAEAHRILSLLEEELAPLYATTCDRCGWPATIVYTVWSDVFDCRRCRREIIYWDVAVDRVAGSVRRVFPCPHCGSVWAKKDLTWRATRPVSTNYACQRRCGRHTERPVNQEELALSASLERESIPDWYPSARFGREREMWRKSHEAMGITSLDAFYTRRNLRSLAALWREIGRVPEPRLRESLRFAFTAIVNRASRRYQWNAKRPTNVQTGTLYIASLSYEWNVLSLFRRKLRDVVAYYRTYRSFTGTAIVLKDSATRLGAIPEGSIDYVFTDPPFGGNIYYADCALLWESWLDEYTDEREEIVIHRKRGGDAGNSTADYQRLMTEAFTRMYKAMRPRRSASVVFHSSDVKLWRGIQESIRDAGFELVGTTGLDKGQPSIKGLRGKRGEEHVAAVDVILNLRKLTRVGAVSLSGETPADIRSLLTTVLEEHVRSLPAKIQSAPQTYSNDQRSTQYLHSLAVRTILDRGIPFREVSFAYVEDLCRDLLELRGNHWYLKDEGSPPESPSQLDLLGNAVR